MAAQCAICLGPVVKGMKFILAGTEVFHDGCAAQHGTHLSIGSKQAKTITDLQFDLSEARSRYRRRDESVREATQLLSDTKIKLREIGDAAAMWKRRYEEMVGRYNDAAADIAAVTQERDRARRDYVELQQRQVAAPPESKAPETRDTRDATEIRYSLLELDID